jgi:DNA topoisomerase-1
LAQPKQRGRRAASREPLKQLGVDASSGKPITVREGRFGLYVTDTETNASLRKGDDLETLTLERAQELLEQRRERGPSQKKKGRKRSPAKAAPAQAAPAKKRSKPEEKPAAGAGTSPSKSAKISKKVTRKKAGKAPAAAVKAPKPTNTRKKK